MLKFDRKQENSVKQLSFNKKINLKTRRKKNFFKFICEISLVVQWLRIHPPMQEMQVQSLIGDLRFHMQWGN